MTPANFRFTCKLPREMTHERRLRDCRTELTRLPPRARTARAEIAGRAHSTAPILRAEGREDRASAISSRNSRAISGSRSSSATPAGIGQTSSGCSKSTGSAGSGPTPARSTNATRRPSSSNRSRPIFFISVSSVTRSLNTTPRGQRVHRYDKLLWKREAALDSWALRIQRHLDEIRSVWTFVNNHYEGFSPETCQRLAERLGFALPLPAGRDVCA